MTAAFGNATVKSPNATIIAPGLVALNTPSANCSEDLNVSGKVTATGDIKSAVGKAGDQVRNLSGARMNFHNNQQHLESGSVVMAPIAQQ